MKNKRIIIFLVAVVFLIAGILVLSKDIMSPYVSFAEAKRKAGTYVQIIGTLEKESKTVQVEGGFSFSMKDDANDLISVISTESKPVDFERADSIVVLGRYNAVDELFNADKLLVKCPSKYQKE